MGLPSVCKVFNMLDYPKLCISKRVMNTEAIFSMEVPTKVPLFIVM